MSAFPICLVPLKLLKNQNVDENRSIITPRQVVLFSQKTAKFGTSLHLPIYLFIVQLFNIKGVADKSSILIFQDYTTCGRQLKRSIW